MYISPIIIKTAQMAILYGVLYTLVQKYFLKVPNINIPTKMVSNSVTFYILILFFEAIKSRFIS